MPSKLDETSNFLDLYLHCAGKWKTPKEFHLWAGVALIAACVEDRVTIPGFAHSSLFPNLWTFLVGGSGTGKDHAIGFALSFLEYDDPLLIIDGRTTIQGLTDMMIEHQRESGRDCAPAFLISSDIPEQLPPGPESIAFTSAALQLYGGRDRRFLDITRTGGRKTVKRPMLNWLVGCVPRWFPKAIDPNVFHSGFAGRCLFVHGEKDQTYAHVRTPILPPDYDLVRAHLRMRVQGFQQAEGQVRFTKAAARLLDAWLYEHSQRKAKNEVEEAVHERMIVLVQKIATVLALADWLGGEIVCRQEHVEKAIGLLPMIERGLRKVGEFIYKTPDTMLKEIVEATIRDAGKISHSKLVALATSRGIKDHKHLDNLVQTLIQANTIKKSTEKVGTKFVKYYAWNERKMLTKMLTERKAARDAERLTDERSKEDKRPPAGDADSAAGEDEKG